MVDLHQMSVIVLRVSQSGQVLGEGRAGASTSMEGNFNPFPRGLEMFLLVAPGVEGALLTRGGAHHPTITHRAIPTTKDDLTPKVGRVQDENPQA